MGIKSGTSQRKKERTSRTILGITTQASASTRLVSGATAATMWPVSPLSLNDAILDRVLRGWRGKGCGGVKMLEDDKSTSCLYV